VRAARALVVVTGAVLLAACGGVTGQGPAAEPPSTAPSTAPSGASSGAVSSCLPGGPQDDDAGVVGLSEAEAVARAQSLGLTTRVAGRGGDCAALTMDFLPDRVNLDLDADGVVRGTSRG